MFETKGNHCVTPHWICIYGVISVINKQGEKMVLGSSHQGQDCFEEQH